MKKGISRLSGFCLVLLCMWLIGNTKVMAQGQKVSNDFRYVIGNNGTATIIEYLGAAEEVIIPSKLDGSSVVCVAGDTFSYNDDVRKITISEGIVELQYGWAFNCYNLEEVHYPSTVELLMEQGNLHTGIPPYACAKLNKITVSKENSDITVYNGDLYSKDMTRFIVHPAGSEVSKVVIPQGVTKISPSAFADCDYLQEVVMSDTVESIGAAAFEFSGLKKINISKKCKEIGMGAFMNTRIEELHIPASVTMIDVAVIAATGKLKKLTVDSANKYYCVKENFLYDKRDDSVLGYPGGLQVKELILPMGIKIVKEYTFTDVAGTNVILLPESVEEVEGEAFCECNDLTHIILGNGLKKLGAYFATECDNLEAVMFRGNPPEIHERAFNDVQGIIYYPDKVVEWESLAKKYESEKLKWIGVELYCEKPAKPYKIANVVSGVHVYWKSVDSAKKYGLWRSETGKEGTYKWVANPTVPHFTDTNVESGKTYYYKVTSISYSDSSSEQSEALGITYVSTPDISSRVNKAAGIQLGWKKVTGATGYAIYRKNYNGSDAWARVGTVEGNSTLTWTDTAVKAQNGTIYRYTIRALAGGDRKTLSGCRNTGRTMVRLTSRTLTSATKASATSIKCNWTTSSAVTGYEIRFMIGSNVYKTVTIGNYKTGSKTFTGLKSGQNYKVQVRSYKKVEGIGTFYSAWSESIQVKL